MLNNPGIQVLKRMKRISQFYSDFSATVPKNQRFRTVIYMQVVNIPGFIYSDPTTINKKSKLSEYFQCIHGGNTGFEVLPAHER